jgi:hypothetical protein
VPKVRIDPCYNGRIWFVDCPGFSQKAEESHSSCNRNGVHYTCVLVSELAKQLGGENVQVITKYAHEVGLIRKNSTLPKNVSVQTVDSFQGLEGTVIILHASAAFVKPNPLGHISNARRLNVALTRAKELMAIVGNHRFWDTKIKRANKINLNGRAKWTLDQNAPFSLLVEEVTKANMVVQLPQEALNRLPDVFVKQGQCWNHLPPKFKPIGQAPKERRS